MNENAWALFGGRERNFKGGGGSYSSTSKVKANSINSSTVSSQVKLKIGFRIRNFSSLVEGREI